MSVGSVQTGLASPVLAFELVNRYIFPTKPKAGLFRIATENYICHAFDVLALSSERSRCVAQAGRPIFFAAGDSDQDVRRAACRLSVASPLALGALSSYRFATAGWRGR